MSSAKTPAIPTVELTPEEWSSFDGLFAAIQSADSTYSDAVHVLETSHTQAFIDACADIKAGIAELAKSQPKLKGKSADVVFAAVKKSDAYRSDANSLMKATGRQASDVLAIVLFGTKAKAKAYMAKDDTPSPTRYAYQLRVQATKDGKLSGTSATKRIAEVTVDPDSGLFVRPPAPSTPSATPKAEEPKPITAAVMADLVRALPSGFIPTDYDDDGIDAIVAFGLAVQSLRTPKAEEPEAEEPEVDEAAAYAASLGLN